MPETQGAKSRSVLISGASIAGPALAYWLDRYGFDVTILERADAIRSGGYPIDVRGVAIDVVERMGVLSQLRSAHIDTRKLTFVDADGHPIAAIAPEDLAGGATGRHIELPRGALTSVLYDLTRDRKVRYRFDDSIEALADDGAGVDVRFRSGAEQRFDIVIGADGMHSNTRALAFGPEAPFNRYLGFCFNLFSAPNDAGFSHEAVIYAEPGRAAGVYAVGDSRMLQAFLIFAADEPPFHSHTDVAAQRQRTAKIFSPGGWDVPRLVAAMQRADDLFFDTVSQIHCRAGLPAGWRWSATPPTRPRSCRDRAPASRWSAPMCLPESWRRMPIPSTPSPLMNASRGRSWKRTRRWPPGRAAAFSCRARRRNSTPATPRSRRCRRRGRRRRTANAPVRSTIR
jgi:2-polyprenyl-6-methoxyphenol hydroxylase-like FAD-dependent oxidoreductase